MSCGQNIWDKSVMLLETSWEHFGNSPNSLVSHTQFNIFKMKPLFLEMENSQTPTNYSIKVSGFSLLKKEVSMKKNVGEEGNSLELWKT